MIYIKKVLALLFKSLGSIWGNIISSTILKPNIVANDTALNLNGSFCGVNDCPGSETSQNIIPPKKSTVYLFF